MTSCHDFQTRNVNDNNNIELGRMEEARMLQRQSAYLSQPTFEAQTKNRDRQSGEEERTFPGTIKKQPEFSRAGRNNIPCV